MKMPPLRAGTRAVADDSGPPPPPDEPGAAVAPLYREHALGLIRLAYVTQGSRAAAEDIVQEAFCGLYRRWDHLSSSDKALAYLRSSVLNGCRNASRRSGRTPRTVTHLPPADSAESAALIGELRREVIAGLRRLPGRQREAHLPGGFENLGLNQQVVSGNGATVAAVLTGQRRNPIATEFAEFSLATGTLLRRWLPSAFANEWVIWSDQTGKDLAVFGPVPGPAGSSALGIMTGARFTPLPEPAVLKTAGPFGIGF